MMAGYDKQEAQAYILNKFDPKLYKDFNFDLSALVSDAIDFDMAYMHEKGVIEKDGSAGERYYDDDDAFEYLLDAIAVKYKMDADTAMKCASFLDDYMDYQQAYLELKGLVDWD